MELFVGFQLLRVEVAPLASTIIELSVPLVLFTCIHEWRQTLKLIDKVISLELMTYHVLWDYILGFFVRPHMLLHQTVKSVTILLFVTLSTLISSVPINYLINPIVFTCLRLKNQRVSTLLTIR